MRILLLLLATSCALPFETRNNNKEDLLAVDKLHNCVREMIGKYGIKAKIAQEVCSDIYKKGE